MVIDNCHDLTHRFTTAKPSLLRQGTSLTCSSSESLTSFENEDNRSSVMMTKERGRISPNRILRSSSSISLSSSYAIGETLRYQIRGMTEGFRKSGLPWNGDQCVSVFAGGTGILYCLPAFACQDYHLEQARWILQGLLSVMADYVHISHDSIFHGIDRFYATFNVLWTLWQATQRFNAWMLLTSVLPLLCFVWANRAKEQNNLSHWHLAHGCWHITGSLAVTLVVFLVHHCDGHH